MLSYRYRHLQPNKGGSVLTKFCLGNAQRRADFLFDCFAAEDFIPYPKTSGIKEKLIINISTYHTTGGFPEES